MCVSLFLNVYSCLSGHSKNQYQCDFQKYHMFSTDQLFFILSNPAHGDNDTFFQQKFFVGNIPNKIIIFLSPIWKYIFLPKSEK